MDITGRITHVLDARGGTSAKTGNTWKLQQYVLETEEQYPKHLCFEVFGEDKINQFNIQVGQTLKVSFDVDAHEYQGRWYNQVRAWKVEVISVSAPVPASTSGASATEGKPSGTGDVTPPFEEEEEETKLPF